MAGTHLLPRDVWDLLERFAVLALAALALFDVTAPEFLHQPNSTSCSIVECLDGISGTTAAISVPEGVLV